MSQSRKLFSATILLAVGYGVAHLLGSPNAPYLSRSPQSGRSAIQAVAFSLSANDPRTNPNLVGGARLLPDRASSEPAKESQFKPVVSAPPVAEVPAPPQLIAPIVDATHIASAAPVGDPYAVPQINQASSQPPNTTPVLEIQPPANAMVAVAPIPREQPAKHPTIDNERKPAAASQVAYNSPAASPTAEPQPTVSPPPWPVERASMRTHIIVDGDSLTKLAGRYLGDPQQSDEIFALNRSVLTSPELLPIGAEIRIPARQGMQGGSDNAPIFLPTAMPATVAGQRGMVQISPVPTMSVDVPRARLLGPAPVESPRDTTQSPNY